MNKLYFTLMMFFLEISIFAARLKPIDFGKIGQDAGTTIAKAVVGVAAAAIAGIGLLGKLGLVDNPIQMIKEKYRLAFITMSAGGIVALLASWIS